MARWVATILLSFSIAVAACGGGTRPTVEDWMPQWDAAQALVPSLDELGEPPDQATCNTVHVALRNAEPQLLPPPDPVLDDPVGSWITTAIGAFFECPPHEPGMQGFVDAYQTLDRYAAEIDTVILIDRDEG